jgi:phage-related protein (TIGR01555 family)
MGMLLQLRDRLANVMSGMGTSVDRRSHASYVFTPLTPQQAEAAYRSSWLVRKIVDIPAKDMTRTWRDWQADDAQIEAIEREERRLQLRAKLQRAVILARLYGGGAIIMGTKDGDPLKEIDLNRVGAQGLTYLHVMSRHQLTTGDPVMDPADPWFGHPSYYQIHAPNGLQPKIHPSRVVPLVGQPVPEGAFMKVDRFWGDPIMQSIGEAVKNADTAQAGFAALIEEAKIDIIKMPDLLDNWAADANEQALLKRLEVAQTGKSIWRQLLLDGEEEWEQRQINWAGIPDIMRAFLEAVAGAADIPVTRLLGQSPKGLQSTGDGEERDYHSKVRADQDEILAPALDRIDDLLIRSALGSRPAEIYFEWSPLVETSEKEAGAIEKQAAETLKIYADTGILGSEQVTAIAQNRMIEVGRWPGCEAAFEEKPDPVDEEDDEEAALAAVTTAAERQAGRASNVVQLKKAGAVTADQATLLIADARPRSLYIQRKLLNAGDFLAWAKGQGFADTLTADDLHVTVLYSRRPVDWLKAGTSWEQKEDGTLVVPPGGARMVEPLGDKGAVVLLFNSSALAWRHEQLVREVGASHDFSEYQPHVTITYAGTGDVDLAEVEPYRGELVFGPEIFEEVDPDWAPKSGAGRKAAGPFEDHGHYLTQPRDPGGEGGGQWVKAGGEGVATEGQPPANQNAKAKPWDPDTKAQVLAANEGKSLDQIMMEAHANQVALRTLGNQLQAETGIEFREPPPGFEVKTRASVERKIDTERYDGPHQLTDISRATFVVESFGEADQVINRLARTTTVYDKGWKHLPKEGYADRKLYITHANGGVSEIQLVPRGVEEYKMGQGHRLYELTRNPATPLSAARAAARRMRTVYHRMLRADGFEALIRQEPKG